MTSFEAVQALKRGSADEVDEALEFIVDNYGARLLAIGCSIAGTDGEDVFWEFMEDLPQRIQTFKWQGPREFRAWLARCVKNAAISMRGKLKREVPTEGMDLRGGVEPAEADEARQAQREDIIATIKSEMSPLLCEALVMLEQRVSAAEFGDYHAISASTARKRKQRAREEFIRIAHELGVLHLLIGEDAGATEEDCHGPQGT